MDEPIQRLESYPEKIAQLEKDILVIKNQASSLKEKLSQREKQILWEVSGEKDINGKKTYPNAEAREIETMRRLQEDDHFQNLRTKLTQAEERQGNLLIDCQKLKDDFSALRYRLRLLTADKMERAAISFTEGLNILSGITSLLQGVNSTRTFIEKEKLYDECPF